MGKYLNVVKKTISFAGKVDEKATQLHAIASLKVLLDATKPQRGAATSTAANNVKINFKETTLVGDRPNGNIDTTLDSVSVMLRFTVTNFFAFFQCVCRVHACMRVSLFVRFCANIFLLCFLFDAYTHTHKKPP